MALKRALISEHIVEMLEKLICLCLQNLSGDCQGQRLLLILCCWPTDFDHLDPQLSRLSKLADTQKRSLESNENTSFKKYLRRMENDFDVTFCAIGNLFILPTTFR